MNWLYFPNELRTIINFYLAVLSCLIIIACGSDAGNSVNISNPASRQVGYQVPNKPYNSDPSVDGFNLKGTLSVAGHVASDWDVNDPDAPYQNNDLPENAQLLETPISVGGFIHCSDNESDEESLSVKDIGDYYAVSLSAGDTIQITALDGTEDGSVKIELHLADDSSTIVSSTILNIGESIEIEEDNDYLVRVVALDGAFNYTLFIGDEEERNYQNRQSQDEFVPGEAIVRFYDDAGQEEEDSGVRSFAIQNNLLTTSQPSSQPILMQFKTPRQKEMLRQHLELSDRAINRQAKSNTDDNAQDDDTLAIISALNQRSDVVYAEPNYYRNLYYTPNDEFYHLQWNYPLIGLEEAWDITSGSNDVIVAVIDSGIRFDHPDLAGKISDDGFDFVSQAVISLDGDGIDPDPTDPGDEPDGFSSFHGTHVAGIIAAATDNNIGVAGVGGETRVMPLRSIGFEGRGTVMDTLQALRYAAGMENDSEQLPRQPANIINLSLGGNSSSQAEAELLEEIITTRNIVVVAAAGNTPTDQPTYPASYPYVISVSAVDFDRQLAPYSSYGDYIAVAAPGGVDFVSLENFEDGILSTVGADHGGNITSDYAFYAGTSMATPHVSGVIALMMAVRPDLTSADFKGWLIQGKLSTDLGQTGWDPYFGYGLINAHQAVITAQNEESPDVSFSVSPARMDFETEENEANIRLSKIGDEELTFTRITSSVDWIEIQPFDIDDEYMGTYIVELDRNHPDISQPGVYEAQITFEFVQQTLNLEVKVEVVKVNEIFDGDTNYIGHLYVLLLDSNNRSTLHGLAANYLGNGQYEFEFNNVSAGEYLIVAGSNRDNDNRIGEPGEALSTEVHVINLDQPINLDRAVDIDFNLPASN